MDKIIIEGASIVCNNKNTLEKLRVSLSDLARKKKEFHQRLLSLGVTAYRYNDGWNDRKKNIVTFFPNDRQEGAYWYSTDGIRRRIAIGGFEFGAKVYDVVSIDEYAGIIKVKYAPEPVLYVEGLVGED